MSILTARWPGGQEAKTVARRIEYRTCGTCCKQIDVEVDADDRIAGVCFHGGCNGNTQGISRLIVGMDVTEAHRRLKGVLCGNKGTSCPDQLARALEEMYKQPAE